MGTPWCGNSSERLTAFLSFDTGCCVEGSKMGYKESSHKCVVYGNGAWKLQALTGSRPQTPPPPPSFWHLISCKRAGLLAQEQWGQVAAVVLMQHPSDIYQTKALGAFQAAAPLGAHAFWGEHRRNQRKIPSWSPGPHVK